MIGGNTIQKHEIFLSGEVAEPSDVMVNSNAWRGNSVVILAKCNFKKFFNFVIENVSDSDMSVSVRAKAADFDDPDARPPAFDPFSRTTDAYFYDDFVPMASALMIDSIVPGGVIRHSVDPEHIVSNLGESKYYYIWIATNHPYTREDNVGGLIKVSIGTSMSLDILG